MSRVVITVRRATLVGICAMCLALGVAVLWVWINPELIASATAVHVLALLGLFVLPAGTLAAMATERRWRQRERELRIIDRDREMDAGGMDVRGVTHEPVSDRRGNRGESRHHAHRESRSAPGRAFASTND